MSNIRKEKGFSVYQLNLICEVNKFANEPDLEARLRDGKVTMSRNARSHRPLAFTTNWGSLKWACPATSASRGRADRQMARLQNGCYGDGV